MSFHLPPSRRLALAAAGALAALLTASCSGGSEPVVSASPVSSLESGPIEADVAAIREFDDPASEVSDAAELTAYLLPGISGPGAECVEQNLDAGAVLAMTPAEGSVPVADLVTQCVEPSNAGSVVLMYAVGFDIDGEDEFPAREACVQAALSDGAAINSMLRQIYEARLDLNEAAVSSDVARAALEAQTDCLADESSSPSP